MKQLSVYTKIKVLLSVLALISLTTVLVAQNTPPKKEVAPAETGSIDTGQNTQTIGDQLQPFAGEEYLVYEKNSKIMLLNPVTMQEENSPWFTSSEDFFKQGAAARFSDPNFFSNQRNGQTTTTTNPFSSTTILPNGDVFSTVTGKDGLWKTIISSPGLPDFVFNQSVNPTYQLTATNRNFITWLDRTHFLISKGNPPYDFDGVFILDITTNKEEVVVEPRSYLEVSVSPSGQYLAIDATNSSNLYYDGEGPTPDNSKVSVVLYNFKTKKRTEILNPGRMIGWTTNKNIAKESAKADFLITLAGCSPFNCLYSNNTVIYKMPFKCGSAYTVSRDGTCNRPADCNLGDGGYPIWGATGNFHNGKRAIDFFRVNGSNDDMPVLAAAGGQVIWSGFQNSCTCTQYPGCDAGYGYHTAVKHSDGTCTIYGHMKEYCGLPAGTQVNQGAVLGIEGYTGHTSPCGVGGRHIHFERRVWHAPTNPPNPNWPYGTYGTADESWWMQFAETGAGNLPQSGRVYLSQNGSCPGACSVTTVPSCGGTITNQSNVGIANTRASYFAQMSSVSGGNAIVQNESGGEKVYEITMNQIGGFKAELLNVVYQTQPPATDLDVFIAKTPTGVCSDFNPLKDFMNGSNFISSSLGVTSTTNCNANYVPPTGKYHIIVDGVNNSQASYQLKVTPCPDISDNGSTKSIPQNSRQLTITANIKNVGCGNFNSPSGSFSTRFFLNTVPNLSGAYTLVTLNYTGGWSIAPNGTTSYTFTWTIPSSIPAGTYYLLETLDYFNNVCEANESNSWYFVGTFTIPPAVNGVADDRADKSEVFASGEVVPVEAEPVLTQTLPIDASINVLQTKCEVTVTGFQITASQVLEDSEFMLANGLGQIICSGKANVGTIVCEAPAIGIYFLTIADRTGNKCTQKVFVNLK